MRLPHFVYPTLELDPDPHVENFLRPALFFWNPAEQLRSDILCPKCDSKMRPDTERSREQHAFRVYGNDELVHDVTWGAKVLARLVSGQDKATKRR